MSGRQKKYWGKSTRALPVETKRMPPLRQWIRLREIQEFRINTRPQPMKKREMGIGK
jgi:hypothetical protein